MGEFDPWSWWRLRRHGQRHFRHMGFKGALMQNRPVLGGNGGSEVGVWAMGLIRRGRYPHIGEMIEEFADKAKNSPGTYEEFGDAKKEAHVRAEKNIRLFLNEHSTPPPPGRHDVA